MVPWIGLLTFSAETSIPVTQMSFVPEEVDNISSNTTHSHQDVSSGG
jgi:hypothetical protein